MYKNWPSSLNPIIRPILPSAILSMAERLFTKISIQIIFLKKCSFRTEKKIRVSLKKKPYKIKLKLVHNFVKYNALKKIDRSSKMKHLKVIYR